MLQVCEDASKEGADQTEPGEGEEEGEVLCFSKLQAQDRACRHYGTWEEGMRAGSGLKLPTPSPRAAPGAAAEPAAAAHAAARPKAPLPALPAGWPRLLAARW